MAQNAPGRHRAPGRHNALVELTTLVKATAQPAVRGAAVLAASGGLVAGLASPVGAVEARVATDSRPVAKAAAPKPVAPRVIEDIIVKEQRAADAKRRAEAKAALERRAAEQRAAEQRAAEQRAAEQRAAEQRAAEQRATARRAAERAATERAAAQQADASRQATRTSRSTSRNAVLPTPAPAKSTRNVYSPPAPAPAPARSGSAIVRAAQSMTGVPYVWGGTTPAGFDCSGFTSWAYRQAGISIPRTASAQQAAARRVTSPQPGDLVFFGYPAYHVGIYVSPGRLQDAQRPGTTVGNHSIWTTPTGYGRF